MLLRLWFNYTYILILVNKKVNIINFLSVKIARPVVYYFFPINCKKSSGEREKEKLWGESALIGKAHRKNGGPQTESTQQETARPHARSGGGPPSAPRRKRRETARKNHHRQPQTHRKGGGSPGTGPEATKASAGRGRGKQAGGTRRGRENHQPRTGATSNGSAHQRDGAARESAATLAEGGSGKHNGSGRGQPDKRIRTGSATDRDGAARRQRRTNNASNERAENRRQPPTARESHHASRSRHGATEGGQH